MSMSAPNSSSIWTIMSPTSSSPFSSAMVSAVRPSVSAALTLSCCVPSANSSNSSSRSYAVSVSSASTHLTCVFSMANIYGTREGTMRIVASEQNTHA
jgi:hypothetical protein